jgi:16S rRNA (guanine527-N7)-methyltransferase
MHMTEISPERIAALLQPYIESPGPLLISQISRYLDLLLRWNARTNLTSIRDPEKMLTRHFGESLFASVKLSPFLHQNATVLDLGSGAGFPGLPLQLFRPDLRVTAAESQHKKAAFLQEVVRTLNLSTTVHAARANTLPVAAFDCVTLRAVDKMEKATAETLVHLHPGGVLAIMTTEDGLPSLEIPLIASQPIPQTDHAVLALYRSS